ncbi:hypothetical protein EMMF5_001052 [Cystobasidiomycetes sp. EMM_F5]
MLVGTEAAEDMNDKYPEARLEESNGTLQGGDKQETPVIAVRRRTKDFGFLPIPQWRQYGDSTLIPTLLQAGYATGLLFIAPAGDMLRRRQLVLLLTVLTTVLAVALALTKSFAGFEAVNFLMGVFTVTPQVMMPLAADLAPPSRRAQSMAIVLSGLMLGLLVARVLGGVIAEFTSFRDVYWMSVGAQAVTGILLYWTLPDYPAKMPDLKYWKIHLTMVKFLFTNPTLIQGGLLGMIASANLLGFWVTLTFLLTDEPYRYSTLVIGLFGVIGIVAVCMAPLVGKMIDRLVPWVAAFVGICILLVADILLLGGAQANVAVIVIGIILLDIGQQTNQVANQSRIYATMPQAGARLNSIYILFLFVGQLIGSSLCSKVYLEYGVREYYGLGCGLIGLNLIICLARGPLKENKRWIGWGKSHEWSLVKRKAAPPPPAGGLDVEKTAELEGKGNPPETEQVSQVSQQEGSK